MHEDEVNELCDTILRDLSWTGPHFKISAATGAGTDDLCLALLEKISEKAEVEIIETEPEEVADVSVDALLMD